MNGEDILFAMTSLGFENYGEALKIYLARYREVSQLKHSTYDTIPVYLIPVFILTPRRIWLHAASTKSQQSPVAPVTTVWAWNLLPMAQRTSLIQQEITSLSAQQRNSCPLLMRRNAGLCFRRAVLCPPKGWFHRPPAQQQAEHL